jgi:hypothetical protein
LPGQPTSYSIAVPVILPQRADCPVLMRPIISGKYAIIFFKIIGFMIVNYNEKAKAIELIRAIQSGKEGLVDLKALERAASNRDIRFLFDVFELEGMAPEKIFEMFFGDNEFQLPSSTLQHEIPCS